MPEAQPAAEKKPSTSGNDPKKSRVLVWVGSVTAVISLILGIHQLWILGSNRLQHRQQINSLIASAEVQETAFDYPAAWATLETANGLGSEARLPVLRENLAMKWLDDVHLHQGETFSDVVKKLEPVLTSGVASTAAPIRKADLLAHIGWCLFLRSRDGESNVDPEAFYQQALKLDPTNPYANSMSGHWILWRNKGIDKARNRFQAAVAGGRERAFVRNIELAALFNNHSDEFEAEVLRVTNDIRKEGGSLDEWSQSHVEGIYSELALNDYHRKNIVSALPAAEQIETFNWLTSQSSGDTYKKTVRVYCLAVLQEAAGRKQEARAGYQSVLQTTPAFSTTLRQLATLGLSRNK